MRDRLLDAAQELVLERGFAATTVDAVLGAAGASKGAFFHHFRSKEALGEALVARYAAQDEAVLDEGIRAAEAQTDDEAEQLIALARWFEDRAAAMLDEHPSCLFVSFIYDRQLEGSETARAIEDAVVIWRERILAKLERAAESRPSLARVDLVAEADHWFVTFEGAFLLAGALGDRALMVAQLRLLRHHIEVLLA